MSSARAERSLDELTLISRKGRSFDTLGYSECSIEAQEIGYEKMTLEDFHTVIQHKNRSNAGASAPAHGLYLTKVIYPESIKIKQ